MKVSGPYLVGGWSAGSIYAYEVCYQLAQQGEAINSLVLIDMQVPRPMRVARDLSLASVEQTGVFTGVNRSLNLPPGLQDRQKMHIAATVRALARYDPIPFPEGTEPRQTHLIWATRGLNDSPRPEEHDPSVSGPAPLCLAEDGQRSLTVSDYALELKSLLFAPRTHLGTNGWERLVGKNIQVSTVEGDHFSIVTPPAVKHLGTVILKAVAMDAELGMKRKA
jgi:thioesterase domain-containing protein